MAESDDLQHSCDLDVLSARLEKLNHDKWRLDARGKTKLHTFVRIYDISVTQAIVKRNLSRPQRSILSKLKCGVL